MSSELIKISTNENGEQLVSGRDLHEFLEIGKDFTNWIKDKIQKYDFKKDVDFTIIELAKNGEAISGTLSKKDYILTISIAKELSMVADNQKGKEARLYFINCENEYKKLKQNPITHNITGQQLIEIGKQMVELEEKRREEQTKKIQAYGGKGGVTANRNHYKRKTEVLEYEVEELREELGACKAYATILAVQKFFKNIDFSWRKLKEFCTVKEMEIKEVPDKRYGKVKTYPAAAWLNLYNIDLEELF
jgi:phage anti-repressor protein